MKALHILKVVLKDTIMSSEKKYINEAIKELEEAQQYAQRVQELEAYCEEQKDTWESQESGCYKVYEKILKELNK